MGDEALFDKLEDNDFSHDGPLVLKVKISSKWNSGLTNTFSRLDVLKQMFEGELKHPFYHGIRILNALI